MLAGCGSSSSSGTATDPAGAVPASSALYVGAVVRPEGGLKSAAVAAGQAFSHQANPYARLLVVLQTPGSPTLNFGQDVAPWLGPNAGIYVTSVSAAGPVISLLEQGILGTQGSGTYPFGAGGAQGALVMDTTDQGKAQSFLDSQAQHAGAHTATYQGVSYQVGTGGVSFALIDKLAVIGSQSGVQGVISTSKGGAALSHSTGYTKLLAAAPAGTLAHVYSNPAAQPGGSAQGPGGLLQVLSGGRRGEHLARRPRRTRCRCTPTRSRAPRHRAAACSPTTRKGRALSPTCPANPGSRPAWATSARTSRATSPP